MPGIRQIFTYNNPNNLNAGNRFVVSRRELLWTFFLFLILPLIYSAGQEKIAFNYPHDDYYFLLRSDDYHLHGNHLAYVREYLYSLFINVTRTLGLGLRNTEVLCYGIAMFWLWKEILNLSRNRLIAWGTTLPLLFFTYQHPVFNRVTYDALQLVLTPLTLASALHLISSRISIRSTLIAGFITGLHALTRPEGMIFLLPSLVALSIFTFTDDLRVRFLHKLSYFGSRLIFLLLVPLLMVQAVSAYNYISHGFWAVTIMKSKPFRDSLNALMSIDPQSQHPDPYGSLPISSMSKAFDASPSFRATKAFFVDHLNGAGWSGFAHYNYRAIDGSISGGHTQWAWFEAVASVAGSTPRQMLDYHAKVAEELNRAFDEGALPRRTVWTTAFGAEFSPFEPPFLHSIHKLFFPFFHLNDPILPRRASRASSEQVERDYDWLALRRKGLVDDQHWQKLGWVADTSRGLPVSITLDEEAVRSKIILERVSRPDVVQALFPALLPLEEGKDKLGFLLIIRGNASGHLVVQYDLQGEPVRIPIQNLRNIQGRRSYDYEGTQVYIDDDYGNSGFAHETDRQIMAISTGISRFLHHFMRFAIPAAFLWLGFIWFSRLRQSPNCKFSPVLLPVTLISLSLFIPRWLLLAALDAGITPAHEPRYMAAGSFALWLLTACSLACLLHWLLERFIHKQVELPGHPFSVE